MIPSKLTDKSEYAFGCIWCWGRVPHSQMSTEIDAKSHARQLHRSTWCSPGRAVSRARHISCSCKHWFRDPQRLYLKSCNLSLTFFSAENHWTTHVFNERSQDSICVCSWKANCKAFLTAWRSCLATPCRIISSTSCGRFKTVRLVGFHGGWSGQRYHEEKPWNSSSPCKTIHF